MEQYKKEHPLLAVMQVNPAEGPVVGYALAKDTATINSYLAMREVQAELPKDLRLKWGVAAASFDPKKQTYELYAIRATERNGRAPLEGDVIVDAKDDFDQYGKPSVSMSMNTDGARRWALLTKQNIGKSIAIVLDGYVYSAPNVINEITGGNSEITGHFTPEEAKDLANVLKSGKMPAPAHIVQEDSRYHFLYRRLHPADGVCLLHVWLHGRYGCQRRPVAQLLLHSRYPFFLPGCIDHVRYRRFGIVTGYGGGCQRVDFRAYQRRTSTR